MLRLDAAGAILRLGLLARLFCEKFIFLGVVTQSLHINQQNTRQGALAVLEFADVDGVVTVTGTDPAWPWACDEKVPSVAAACCVAATAKRPAAASAMMDFFMFFLSSVCAGILCQRGRAVRTTRP